MKVLANALETSDRLSIAHKGFLFGSFALGLFDPLYGIIVGCALILPSILGKLLRFGPQIFFYGAIFALIVMEGDYPEYEALIEEPSLAFFSQKYIPVFSPFEITGILLLGWTFLKCQLLHSSFPRKALWSVAFFTSMHFIVACLMMGYGLAQGGRLQIAFWQMKSFMVFPIWALLGFLIIRTPREATRILSIILAAGMCKSIYNLEVLVFGLGGTRGLREYFTSHIGSLLMAVPMLIAMLRLKLLRVPRATAAVYWVYIAFTLYMWIENDRRASLMGAVLSIIFSFVASLPLISRKTIKKIATVTLSIGLIIGLTWELPAPTPGGILKSIMTHGNRMDENIPDYRDIENYNLFSGISKHPLGRGYGFPFEQPMALPDIFGIAEMLSWVPHNSLLMIWAFGGPQNVAAFALLFVMSIAVSVRLIQTTTDVRERMVGLIAMMTMIQWLIYVWADMAWTFVPTISVPACLVGGAAGLLARREKKLQA